MSLLTEARMDKTVFSIVSLYDESDDDAYWHTQTPEARLEALELQRQISYGYDPSTQRLQRLFETVEREEV